MTRSISRAHSAYGLSYIQRMGNGHVFYEAHGHDENVYYLRPFVAHMLAGIQYAWETCPPTTVRAKSN